jgi:hypothetical protein
MSLGEETETEGSQSRHSVKYDLETNGTRNQENHCAGEGQ